MQPLSRTHFIVSPSRVFFKYILLILFGIALSSTYVAFTIRSFNARSHTTTLKNVFHLSPKKILLALPSARHSQGFHRRTPSTPFCLLPPRHAQGNLSRKAIRQKRTIFKLCNASNLLSYLDYDLVAFSATRGKKKERAKGIREKERSLTQPADC